ncbi:hypothetical protein [Flavobacterium frigoris]|uniref:Uncharacterized protein n=1 Tax=Flavobacterium frigoris (strain PS1) TaxID=1086011 RepID=H7FSV0_FLAFP|nr:hypothetical protein [Flavobacterium frigoris]EIA08659.1 hypothetical protein HJ01_02381 [Flavobacterium frigoris PS1]
MYKITQTNKKNLAQILLLKNNKLNFELKENSVLLNFNFDALNNKEILFLDIKRVHLETVRLAPLYRTILILSFFCITVFGFLLIHTDWFLTLCFSLIGIVTIIKEDFMIYSLEIQLVNGETLINKIPNKLRRQVINSIFEIRKQIFISRIKSDISFKAI